MADDLKEIGLAKGPRVKIRASLLGAPVRCCMFAWRRFAVRAAASVFALSYVSMSFVMFSALHQRGHQTGHMASAAPGLVASRIRSDDAAKLAIADRPGRVVSAAFAGGPRRALRG